MAVDTAPKILMPAVKRYGTRGSRAQEDVRRESAGWAKVGLKDAPRQLFEGITDRGSVQTPENIHLTGIRSSSRAGRMMFGRRLIADGNPLDTFCEGPAERRCDDPLGQPYKVLQPLRERTIRSAKFDVN